MMLCCVCFDCCSLFSVVVLLIFVLAFLVSACFVSCQRYKYKMHKDKLSHEESMKSQEWERKKEWEYILKDKSLEKVKDEYDKILKTKDEEIAEYKGKLESEQQIDIDRISLFVCSLLSGLKVDDKESMDNQVDQIAKVKEAIKKYLKK